jgi:hypothetical protein
MRPAARCPPNKAGAGAPTPARVGSAWTLERILFAVFMHENHNQGLVIPSP